MKLNINGKEVDLIVNGEKRIKVVKKPKLSDKDLLPDEQVRKIRDGM